MDILEQAASKINRHLAIVATLPFKASLLEIRHPELVEGSAAGR
jgi:hypothetical protein